jgi:hypothetical protein
MSASKAVFVLVHGGWHSHSAWDRVTPILAGHHSLSPVFLSVTCFFIGQRTSIRSQIKYSDPLNSSHHIAGLFSARNLFPLPTISWSSR